MTTKQQQRREWLGSAAYMLPTPGFQRYMDAHWKYWANHKGSLTPIRESQYDESDEARENASWEAEMSGHAEGITMPEEN